MTTMILVTPYVAFVLGVAMMMRALHLYSETRPQMAESNWRKIALIFFATLTMPSLVHAQAVDLKAATESGNAIIMYLSGTLAAVGIVAAGVAMMLLCGISAANSRDCRRRQEWRCESVRVS